MREECIVNHGIDSQRIGRSELLRPVDPLHGSVKRLWRINGKSSQWLKHANGRTALEHSPVERFRITRRRGPRKLDRPPTNAQICGPHLLQLTGKHPFQAFERASRHPGWLIGLGCGQRPWHRGNIGEHSGAMSHACRAGWTYRKESLVQFTR